MALAPEAWTSEFHELEDASKQEDGQRFASH